MNTRFVVSDSATCQPKEIERCANPAGAKNRSSHLRSVGASPYRRGRVLAGPLFRVVRDAFGALVLITDPEKVRETLGLLDDEPGGVTHD